MPLAKFRKLKEFINLKLPPGFPVKIGKKKCRILQVKQFNTYLKCICVRVIIDIPIVPTVTAKVSFKNFSKICNFDEKLFKIPDDYVEEESVLDKLLVKEKKSTDAQ